jgi:uncharacterized membrane protein
MSKDEFLKRLNKALGSLDAKERARTVQYYREILEDRMEDGIPEEEAVANMGPVEQVAADVLAEQGVSGKEKRSGWSVALIALGSPLWLVLLLAVGAVLLSMYAVVWAVIITLFSCVAALGAGALAGVFALCLFWTAYPMTGLFLLGVGLVCAGLGIFLFFPVLALTKRLVRGTVLAGKNLWHKVTVRKGEAA